MRTARPRIKGVWVWKGLDEYAGGPRSGSRSGGYIKEKNNNSHTSSFCKKINSHAIFILSLSSVWNSASKVRYLNAGAPVKEEELGPSSCNEYGTPFQRRFLLRLTKMADNPRSVSLMNIHMKLDFFIYLSVHVPLLEVTHLVAVVVVGEKARRGAISGRLKKIVLKNQPTRFPS